MSLDVRRARSSKHISMLSSWKIGEPERTPPLGSAQRREACRNRTVEFDRRTVLVPFYGQRAKSRAAIEARTTSSWNSPPNEKNCRVKVFRFHGHHDSASVQFCSVDFCANKHCEQMRTYVFSRNKAHFGTARLLERCKDKCVKAVEITVFTVSL